MATIDFKTLDITPYQSAPKLTANGTIRLIRDLERAMPAEPSATVVDAAARMTATAGAIKAQMMERAVSGGVDTTAEVRFDITCDRLWTSAVHQLEKQMHYGDDALLQLNQARRDKIELEHRREQAILARELYGILFSNGTDFLRMPFTEQVQQMATRLELVRASPKAAAYEEVLGDGLLVTLEQVQGHYDEMVHARVMRDKSTGPVRDLRNKAMRQISMYASAVLLMIKEDDAESATIAITALRPIYNARTRRSSSSTESEAAVETQGSGLGVFFGSHTHAVADWPCVPSQTLTNVPESTPHPKN